MRLQPDWVLMDITMKVVDGITATRQIIAADPKAQVIIVTDYH
jgi:DNA-binding NarL/FixJ family response regulator